MRMSRRHFLSRGSLAAASVGTGAFFLPRSYGAPRMATGEAFDNTVNSFMQARKIPGGALAVIKDKRLVYACGYGWADVAKKGAARPDSLFRIASISKTFTGVA